jgi:hypothetical protein
VGDKPAERDRRGVAGGALARPPAVICNPFGVKTGTRDLPRRG